MRNIITIIADDEPPSLRILRKMLQAHKNIRIAAECTSGPEAVRAIERIKPDLAFLDIQMPGCNGLEILERTRVENPPITIFVTAFDKYAVTAFQVNALDYILKPYDHERIGTSIARVEKQLQLESRGRGQPSRAFPVQHAQSESGPLERLLLRKGNRLQVLKVEDIDWIGAAGDYIEIHARGHLHLMHEKIGAMERKLDPRRFQRIHRSTIVNVECVVELEPLFHLDHAIILKDGNRVTLSRTYYKRFIRTFSTIGS
jgi:two-component system LytT family response regulator